MVTSGGWYTPNGRSIDGLHDPKTNANIPGSGGIIPDIEVPVSAAEAHAVKEGIAQQLDDGATSGAATDSALEAAVQALSQPLAEED